MAEDRSNAAADQYVSPSTEEIRATARALAQGSAAGRVGQSVGPWDNSNNPERAWPDGVPNVYNRPHPSTYDENYVAPEPQAVSGIRDIRPAPAPPPRPRRDLIWEPGTLSDINRLSPSDQQMAVMRVHSLIYDLPGSGGPLIGDPAKIGGTWHEARFASVVSSPEMEEFERRLRMALPGERRNDIRAVPGAVTDLRGLPNPQAKQAALDQIRHLAVNGPSTDDLELETPSLLVSGLHVRPLGDGNGLVYQYEPRVYSDQRSVVRLVGITDRVDGALTDTIAERLQPEGRIVYRILNEKHAPGNAPAVQVLAVQGPGQLDDAAVAEYVNELKLRTELSRGANQGETPRYSLPVVEAGREQIEGARVVRVASKVAAEINGQTVASAPVPTRAATPAETFERQMTQWLPRDRRYNLRISPGVDAELRQLPAGAKQQAAAHLRDLTMRGPQPQDRKRSTPAGTESGTAPARRDVDLREFRPRYFGGSPDAPSHQIIYRQVNPQTLRKVGSGNVPDDRPIIHVVAVRPFPDPTAPQVVADRIPKRAAEWLRNPANNRGLTDEPLTVVNEGREVPLGDEQFAEVIAERQLEQLQQRARNRRPTTRAEAEAGRYIQTPPDVLARIYGRPEVANLRSTTATAGPTRPVPPQTSRTTEPAMRQRTATRRVR